MSNSPNSIFIQIASYRDPELLPTMRDAVAKAARPENLSFGVCFQENAEHPDYMELKAFPQCRVIQVDPENSGGACAARAAAQSLWQGEAYTLQIDSHTRFVEHWDADLLEMIKLLEEKAILTAYCPDYEPPVNSDNPLHDPVAYTLGADGFSLYGSLLFQSRIKLDAQPRPVPGAFWSGHFSFSSARAIEDIPYDPSLYFHGEEITYAVRAWTKGWELYYPSRAVCYHHYSRNNRVTHWIDNDGWRLRDVLSQQRVRRLLDMEPKGSEDFGVFGLGEARTLAEYEAFSGVDFKNMRFSAKAWNGWFSPEPPPVPVRKSPGKILSQNVLLVTAFRDVGRGGRAAFRRDRALYMEWFGYLAALKNIKLVCYCPDDLRAELPTGDYTVRDYDLDDTFFKTYYNEEKEIMARPEFREFIGERILNPEHSNPDYSLATHCKANFVRRAAQQYPGYSHYIWVDFGGLRIPVPPESGFDWSRLLDGKIHMQVFGELQSYPEDPRELCKQSPDALSAAIFSVPNHKAKWYEEAYEQELIRNHELGLADDEQNIMLRLIRQYPGEISADQVGHWQGFLYNSLCEGATLS